MKNRMLKGLWVLLSIFFWIGLWWLLAALFQKPLLLPTPLAVLGTLWELMKTPLFWKTVLFSLSRILIGIAVALLAGAALAVLTVRFRMFHHLFSPLLTLFKATPVASIIFLILLWVGRDSVPLVIAFMMALPIVWSNVREGLLQSDKQLLEVTRVFGFSWHKKLFALYLPSLSPYFAAACRSAIGIAWKAGIAAEVLCVPKDSIGRAIYEGKQYLLTNELFAWTLTVVLISVVIERGTLWLLAVKEKRKESL